MKKISAFFFALCLIFALTGCNSLEATGAEKLRSEFEKHEFLGVTFYLPAEFTQSNIFADEDTGRISYTNQQGMTVQINVNETSFISQYFNKDISNAQSYAQIYYDSYSSENSQENPLETELSSRYDVPYISLCGNIDGIMQFGLMGFYYAGDYCACISVHTENESLFSQNKEDIINLATIATFTH